MVGLLYPGSSIIYISTWESYYFYICIISVGNIKYIGLCSPCKEHYKQAWSKPEVNKEGVDKGNYFYHTFIMHIFVEFVNASESTKKCNFTELILGVNW